MTEKLMNAALQSYEKNASENDIARLEFFRGIWKIQQDHSELIAAKCSYEAPCAEEAEKMYWDFEPFFSRFAVTIEKESFAQVLQDIAKQLCDHAGLDTLAQKALDEYNWNIFADKVDLKLAGRDPSAFINDCLEHLDDLNVPTDLPATIFAMVPMLALRSFLQKPARMIMDSLNLSEGQMSKEKPQYCPACGSEAALSIVGEGSTQQGGGRTLFCTSCGTEWAFDRIRCARCGSKDQTKLNYFNIEGDSAHRLQNCQNCGDYLRVVYQQESKNPICPDVEDVVMARLDMVANDDRFKTQMDAS